MIFTITAQSRRAIVARIQEAPEGHIVKISEPRRTEAQNALLHAELSEIADKVKWAGQHRSIDDWKRLLTCAWMRATKQSAVLLPAVDGQGFDVLYRRTSTMGKSEMIELIDYIQAWKAERPEFQETTV